jgi:hypothetical protein
MTAHLLAQEDAGVLLRSFVIALVLVAPVALWQWRRIRARRSAVKDRLPTSTDGATGDDITTGRRPSDPGSLEAVVSRIAELATLTQVGDVVSIEVPEGATVQGRPVPPSVWDPIVRDALAREGFEFLGTAASHEGTPGASVFECRRR